VQVEVGID